MHCINLDISDNLLRYYSYLTNRTFIIETDKPISKLTEDKLNRKTFVEALAVEIENIDSKDCNVIGLYGKWGSGKTSIIKLLDEELKEKYFFTSYFNPWRYKSENILLRELFLKIIEGAHSDTKLEGNIQKLGKFLEEYSEYIEIPVLVTKYI